MLTMVILYSKKEKKKMLKRLYVEDANGESAVLFVDGNDRACYLNDTAFNELLTLEVAKNTDYSNFDDCETADEAAANYYTGENVIDYNPDDWEKIIEF